jgi:hypothetical protein
MARISLEPVAPHWAALLGAQLPLSLVRDMELSAITLAMFSVFNVLRLGSYLPQIIRVATDTEGAKAISYSTWGVWVGANGSTAVYALVNISDWALFAISTLNTVGCATVLTLTVLKRRQFAQRERNVRSWGDGRR